jgi:nanoRNase/pAp phosphatase (c-di-AMP/oligoRNAs hydrolase)
MKEHLESLLRAVRDVEGLVILAHNDPDPDAIASAVALRYLLQQKLGVESDILYKGIIGRAENRALVRYLGRPLRRLTRSHVEASRPVALIDSQPGTGNNACSPGCKATLVFDHHPLREATAEATFYDVRSDVGATSTMLTQYLQAADLEFTPPLATALFYGIKTDTMGLSRGACQADVDAFFYLQPQVDLEALVKIERAQVPAEYFSSLVATLEAARVYDHVLVSYLGVMNYPGLAAEMADLLLRLRGVKWVICLGVHREELILSVRTRRRGGAERLVQDVVGDRGTAGGHGSMAGGQIPLCDHDPDPLAVELGRLALSSLQVEEATGEPII